MEWTIYIDESGSFARARRSVHVGGLLLGTAQPTSLLTEATLVIEAAMRQQGVPPPLHAWHADRLVMHLVWRLRAGEATRPERSLAKRLARECPVDFAAVTEPASRLPDLAPVSRIESLVRSAREVAVLFDVRDGLAGQVGRAIDMARSTGQRDGTPMLLVGASEARLGDAVGDGDSRYLTLLGCLCARVVDIVSRTPGHQRVRVWVQWRPDLTRAAVVKAIAAQAVRDFGASSVSQATTEIVVAARGNGRERRVALLIEPPQSYDRGVDIGFVLADWVCYRSGAFVERPSARDFALDLRSSTRIEGTVEGTKVPALLTFAASGVAQAYVTGCRMGESPSPGALSDAETRAWARTQALGWGQEVAS